MGIWFLSRLQHAHLATIGTAGKNIILGRRSWGFAWKEGILNLPGESGQQLPVENKITGTVPGSRAGSSDMCACSGSWVVRASAHFQHLPRNMLGGGGPLLRGHIIYAYVLKMEIMLLEEHRSPNTKLPEVGLLQLKHDIVSENLLPVLNE